MTDPHPANDPPPLEEVIHVSLLVGRLLQQNGADSAHVRGAVEEFASRFGCHASLNISYASLQISAVRDGEFRTKVGPRIPALGVNMTVIEGVNTVMASIRHRGMTLQDARRELERIEGMPARYGRLLISVALGLTAAGLSRLFGGDWTTFWVTWMAGAAGTLVRLELARRGGNLFFVPLAGALLSGVLGGIGARMTGTLTPALCLVGPGMIIVPGVPLINGIQDLIRNHMTLGLARLALGGMITLAIASGLGLATVLTGVRIPVELAAPPLPVVSDALFAAVAAVGYTFLFHVPPRMIWACVLCGTLSHATRTLCVLAGMDMVTGTLLGAAVAGTCAVVFSRRFEASAALFAFPGVVAMVPGSYAFRAMIGSLEIMSLGEGTPLSLLAGTWSLVVSLVLMTAAIAVGIAVPLAVCPERR
ncbi:MAG: threonine/serine exporter family protein [Verrucomicrobiae bacterium]|nr:threonine/serine exporter family protein [Verrucomicrobiae bacterium]